MRQRLSTIGMCMLFMAASLPACNRSASSGSGSSDADSDGDTDADGDSGSDSDSDTDSDGDTATWPNGDTAPEGYGEVAEACWLATFGGESHDEVIDAVSLDDDTAVVAGMFHSSVTIGAGEPSETVFTSTLENPHFIARYDTEGSLIWARQLDASIADIAAVGDEAVVILGEFGGTGIFSVGEADEVALDSYSEVDSFVARYSADGGLEWVRQDGGNEHVTPRSLAVLSNGSYVAAGSFMGQVTFGLGEAHETTLEADPGTTVFIARYYPDGLLAWARTDCGGGCIPGRDIAPHPTDGSFLLSGRFSWEATFDEGGPNETTVSSSGLGGDEYWTTPHGMFMALYDLDGQLLWVESAEHNMHALTERTAAAAMHDSSFVAAGDFSGDMGFDYGGPDEIVLHAPYEIGESIVTSNTLSFAARTDDEGELLWVIGTSAGMHNNARAVNAVSMADERLIVSGSFNGAVNFGPGDPEDTWLVSESTWEPYAVIYTYGGEIDWLARLATGWENTRPSAAAGLSDGTFLFAGSFEGATEFLTGDDTWETVTSVGARDGFVLHVCP